MSWNHRVVRHKNPRPYDEDDKYYYRIHEVYYREDGSIWAMTKESVEPHGLTVEELEEDLRWMLKALRKPVLDYDMEFSPSPYDEAEPDSVETHDTEKEDYELVDTLKEMEKGISVQEKLFESMDLTHKKYHMHGLTTVYSIWRDESISIVVEHSGLKCYGSSRKEIEEDVKALFGVNLFEMLPSCEGYKIQKWSGNPEDFYIHHFLFER